MTAADWHAASKWYDTAARVRSAYYEYAASAAVLRESERVTELFAEGLSRTEKLAAGGKVDAYDVTRLKVELTLAANRVGAARQRVAAAERMLAVAVGVERLQGVAVAELPGEATPPGYDEAVALAGRSSFVLAAAAEAEQARVEVRQAEVRPVPNVQTMTTVAHDFTTRAPMASVQVGLPLPLWDKNQGNVAAAKYRLRRQPRASSRPGCGRSNGWPGRTSGTRTPAGSWTSTARRYSRTRRPHWSRSTACTPPGASGSSTHSTPGGCWPRPGSTISSPSATCGPPPPRSRPSRNLGGDLARVLPDAPSARRLVVKVSSAPGSHAV